MYKLMGLVIAALPIILFLRPFFMGRFERTSQAAAEFRRQVHYLVWGILIFVGCGVAYSIAKLEFQF
jgi:hypothetical protein